MGTAESIDKDPLSRTHRAQRLTASEVWAQRIEPRTAGQPGECSTPYGIRGLGTLPAQPRLETPLSAVLNALRHQRFGHFTGHGLRGYTVHPCSTPYGIRGLGTGPTFTKSGADNACSTPYGIRGLGTGYHPPALGDCPVLNALRHQRFGHDRLIRKSRQSCHVLNALRHQRFGHSLSSRQLCGLMAGVLNALRHQRFGHAAFVRSRSIGLVRAQRLTASEVWARTIAC